MYRASSKIKVGLIEYIASLCLFYQLGLLTELLFNMFVTHYYNFVDYNDLIMNMSSNNQNNSPGQNNNPGQNNSGNFPNPYPWLNHPETILAEWNLPVDNNNMDLARLVRYISGNLIAYSMRQPRTRLASAAMTNGFNVILDVISNEQRANYWIDQYNHWIIHGRLRGGQSGYGPFERGTNPFEPPSENNNGGAGYSGVNNFANSNNPLDLIRDFLSPVDHSIPLPTLVNVHTLIHLCLFFMVLALLLLTLFFYINLIIISNKDYLLNNVKNRYILWYVKYVIFKSRIDIYLIGLLNICSLIGFAYVLHYLITHPIIL